MAWTVGHEDILIGDHIVECVWEVDASSEAEAFADPNATPYILAGIRNENEPYPQIDWHDDTMVRRQYGSQSVAVRQPEGAPDEEGGWDTAYCALLTQDQLSELADAMNKAQDGVSMADFWPLTREVLVSFVVRADSEAGAARAVAALLPSDPDSERTTMVESWTMLSKASAEAAGQEWTLPFNRYDATPSAEATS